LRADVVATTVDLLGTPPDDVVLAPPGAVPKTSSGKIRRAACRDRYERGMIGAGRPAMWRQLAGLAVAAGRARVRALARSAVTGLFAAYAWVLTAMVGTPVWLAVVVLPSRRWRWGALRGGARLLTRLAGVPVAVRGSELLPASGPYVVAANHPSYVDGLALILALPGFPRFVAASEFARRPISGTLLRRLDTEFVHRHDPERAVGDARRLSRRAAEGHTLVFFPEGGLAPEPGLRPFHTGAFTVAAEAHLPVVPVAIRGTRAVVAPGQRSAHPGVVQVIVAPPLAAEQASWDEVLQLRQNARAAILEHCGEPDLG
ncbi:MAG TPA: 1-acyl-sn-glycerol-3-phosphate acyltransferase, partial [Acidimicrobiia bacterium]|nr:1-acyl-sn-glycerol-3-phosphate acyltransferase [Acidimicrobiia bacterium]